MQVLDLALLREQEAEDYYRELAGKSPDTGLANILTRLADVERRHQDVIKCMQEDNLDCDAGDSTFLGDVREQFQAMRRAAADFEFDGSQVDLYEHAQGREQESHDLYAKEAETASDPRAKAIFERLAAQETMHYQILGSIIEFVSRADPGNWLENAEWYHLDAY